MSGFLFTTLGQVGITDGEKGVACFGLCGTLDILGVNGSVKKVNRVGGILTDFQFELLLLGHDRFKLNLVGLLAASVANLGYRTLTHRGSS